MPTEISAALDDIRLDLTKGGVLHDTASLLESLYLISDHDPQHYGIADAHMSRISACHDDLEKKFPGWEDRLAGARYETVESILKDVLRRPEKDEATFSDRIDAVLLNPVFGFGIMLSAMVLLLYTIFALSEHRWAGSKVPLAGRETG